jgi:hypothetical protein
MTYSSHDGELVLFGGDTSSSSLTDTWLFRNGSWINDSSAGTPVGGAMSDDPADGYVVLFASNGGTWSFENGTWARLNPSVSPSARGGEALFYDSIARGVILWGGSNAQTWKYAAGDWTQLTSPTSPPAGGPVGFGYDSAFGYGIVFGPTGPPDNSTWTYADGNWTNMTSVLGRAPPAATYLSFAYDSTDGYAVALDEVAYKGIPNETWILRDPLTLNVSASATVRDLGQNLTYDVTVQGGIRPYLVGFPSAPPGCAPPSNVTNATSFGCTLNRSGSYTLNVSVTDTVGASVYLLLPLAVNPDPSASIVAYPNPITVGIPIGLDAVVNGGTPPSSGHWTLSDGTVANGSVLNHTFAAPGAFRATFSGSDAAGFAFAANVSIVVNAGLGVTATASGNVTDVGIPIQLNASASGGTTPLSYSWNFGDGASAAVNATTHAFDAAGNFDPRVWVNDSVGAVMTAAVPVRVNPALMVNATANATSPALGSPVQFTALLAGGTGPYTYWWNFGDGGTNRNASASHVFGSLGVHTAIVEVNDSVGGSRSLRIAVNVVAAENNTVLPPPTTGGGVPWVTIVVVGAVGVLVGVGIGAAVFARRPPREEGRAAATSDGSGTPEGADPTASGENAEATSAG